MQLKGLVRFFALALILICLYQLSFTWIVRSYESSMSEKAGLWVKAMYPKTTDKDSLELLKKQRLQRLLDSTKDSKIGPFGMTTYRNAKDKELMLGLDLQGGMSVTMEVGLDGLIKSLANYTKDPVFNKALDAAVKKKATSGADLITLFTTEFKNASAGAKLAPYFVSRSNEKIKYDASDDAVAAYLRDQAKSAFDNTTRILTTRIDRFGVASPNINPDPQKGIINIELAGINDPERVRHYLQSTANLQFFEVYNLSEVGDALQTADKAVADYLKGTPAANDTTKKNTDTTKQIVAQPHTNADTTKTYTLSGIDTGAKKTTATPTTTDSTQLKKNENPILGLFAGVGQGYRDPNTGSIHYPAYIADVMKKDT